MQLAALGLFVFELASFPFEDMSRRAAWRHGRTARVGARDASQYLGPGDDTLQIGGRLFPTVAGSYGAIERLRAMADEGEVYDFVDGSGTVWGGFVITSLDEQQNVFLDDGTPRRKDFTIELTRVD